MRLRQILLNLSMPASSPNTGEGATAATPERTPNGWPYCSTTTLIATLGGSRPDCVLPGCVTAKLRSRTSTSCVPGGEKRAFNILAAWSSFALFFPILLMSRLA
jgi:hypothetical protein